MWRDALREDGASGSVDTGPARLGLLIALIPTSLGLPLRPTSLVPSVPHTVSLWMVSHRGLVISGNHGSTVQTVPCPADAYTWYTPQAGLAWAARPQVHGQVQVQVHGQGSRLLWHTV